jgi:hypothetical protein
MNFRKTNNLTGWITFAIATFVYLKTMEPTTSFWDCGEFLSCAYKIEVGHSPGAPLFMMIQRMFGLLAGGNLQKVAIMINAWSAIASGLTILFLFWTITHFAKKLITQNAEEPTSNQVILIMGAGLVGALAYTFSDTFWFSAVEAEVYASSSFFTAITFWAILKWEHSADNKYADRWLIFIAYMIGLSVGVHLLSLLTIPAVAMVYYFRRFKVTTINTIIAFIAGCFLLGFVQFGVLQGIPILASKFDLLFVNSFGMPFDSGAITFLILLVAVIVWALFFVKKKGWNLAHTGILCITFVLIGFSSYLAPLIRSRADTPIDMTNPDNTLSLTSYLQREQFGQQPLLFGPDFSSRPTGYDLKGYQYARSKKGGKDIYEPVGQKMEPTFDASDKRFFPRIWDYNDPQHMRFYRQFLGLGENDNPTSADNFKFFFDYQINWMWWRYFMWNYAGRQNDLEGQGEPKNGNWITGIKFIDQAFGRGDIDKMNDGLRNSPARNQLFLLPFILGILGIIYQFNRDKANGITTFVLFFFTGIAIAIFLNMPPLQPRERDYAFVGSMYAYAIWIGLGVLMVNDWMQKAMKGSTGTYAAIGICLLAVPVLMAKEEWDDHDRSKKFLARDSAYNVLESCAPNAILFTFGDNDTYPVWYAQEVEGIRPDVRVINTSLLGIDWYIDQLNYRINDADAIPMVWKKENYIGDHLNYLRYYAAPQIPQDRYFNLQDICKFMVSDDPSAKISSGGESENFLPTKNLFVASTTKENLVKNGFIKAEDTARIDNSDIKFKFPKEIAMKDDLATLNIVAAIAKNGWNRPIYFGAGLPGDNYVGLDDYLRLEGVVYRLCPFKVNDSMKVVMQQEQGSVDLNKSYDLIMKKYKWGNAQRNDVYYDEKNRQMFMAYRINGSRIANELSARGRNKEAVDVLDKISNNISEHSYYYDATEYYIATSYYRAGAKMQGRKVSEKLVKNAEDDLSYYSSLSESGQEALGGDKNRDLAIIEILRDSAQQAGDIETAKKFDTKLQALRQKYGKI